jgi:hypothetical protein
MSKWLKVAAVLIPTLMLGFWCMMNEECFLSSRNKSELFKTYLARASDPHENRLRLAETTKIISNGKMGKIGLTTLKFVDEKHYLNTFSKTYKLLITRETGIDDREHDWIDAGLYMDVDYGIRTDHEIIFNLRRVGKNDVHWNVLSSFHDNPVHHIRKKICKPAPEII